ncbi:hypothetical protein [Nonomuraea dietziae]|uniref:hypothetical protein n=1 Tax=Nonomuraea dietziae TaxID=65515 RepID=UPI003401147F
MSDTVIQMASALLGPGSIGRSHHFVTVEGILNGQPNACRGNGEYELKFEGGTVHVTPQSGSATLTIPAFSVKARGCV